MYTFGEELPDLNHCIWLEEKKFAFVFVPKVACTSWKIFLHQAIGRSMPADMDYKKVHNRNELKLPYVGSMSERMKIEFKQKLKSGEIRCHAMIRDPYARVLSAYLDKILNHKKLSSKFSRLIIPDIQRKFHKKSWIKPTFNEFLAWCDVQGDPSSWNTHWRPMSKIVGNLRQTKIWTIEQTQIAVKNINKIIERNVEFPSSSYLGDRIVYKSDKRIEEYYGETERKLVDRMYCEDLKLYEYFKNKEL